MQMEASDSGGRTRLGMLKIAIVLVIIVLFLTTSILYLALTSTESLTVIPSWSTETVVTSRQWTENVGYYLSLALDGAGNPHISYLSSGYFNSRPMYASRSLGEWQTEVPGDESYGGDWNWIGIDPKGRPNIVYNRGNGINMAIKSTEWQVETVDPTGEPISMTMDYRTDTYPVVAYSHPQSFSESYLVVAEKGISGWTQDKPNLFGWMPAMALGPGNEIHLLYLTTDAAIHAMRSNGVWTTEIIGPSPNDSTEATSGSIAVASDGAVHVAYENDGVLTYAVRSGIDWEIESVDDGLDCHMARGISLALQSNGLPAIGYIARNHAIFTWNTNKGWESEEFDTAECGVSVALDQDSIPHMAYRYWLSTIEEQERSVRYVFADKALTEKTRGSDSDVSDEQPSNMLHVNDVRTMPKPKGREYERIQHLNLECSAFNIR